MKKRLTLALLLVACSVSFAAEPLRVFIRVGKKTHGPAGNGRHEHPKFLEEWKPLLAARGAKVDGANTFPTAQQLENTDVLVIYSEEGGTIAPGDRANLDKFLKRGGGIVAIHDSVCGNDAHWWKTIIGGAWEHGHSKWFEGEVPFYYTTQEHPITESCSNFDFDDEMYYDLHMMPNARILGTTWTPDKRNTRGGKLHPHIYDVAPQMWTYETNQHRAFVYLPGHSWKTFELPHVRAVLLRGIAWAGKRDADLLCKKEELASLRYPEGGPTAPGKARAKLELRPDFEMGVVAAEPLINKPINIDWDPSGRLWVAETPEYPNGRRGIRPDQRGFEWKDAGGIVAEAGKQDRPAKDRISILIDENGDGMADKKEIFYEGLELVTGFVFHRDGVIVAQAPDVLWLRDTNKDGKADKVETLYTGLGTSDTHAVINNLRWGFDGWIYATHGYSAGNVRSGDSSKDFGRIGSGVVRFKPDGSAFEQYSSKNGNTWGLDITSDNEVMFTQPTSSDLLNHVVMPEYLLARGKVPNTTSFKPVIKSPKSYPLIKSENLAYVQIDLVGTFTAAAGCAIYEGGAWPAEWNYSYFTTEPTINIVHHEVVKPDGVTFTGNKTRQEEFIGGRDLWYRPIETRVGPDGALYILDFYNQAVIHNDTRGPKHNAVNAAVRPDRDHYFGRIWRVNHKQAQRVAVPDLAKASAAELVSALESPSRAVRMSAHRLLAENMTEEAVAGLRKAPASRDPAPWVHRLWLLGTTGQMPPFIINAALTDDRAAVRKNAMRVLATNPGTNAQQTRIKEAVLSGLTDKDPRVRLEAIVAAGALPVDDVTATALVSAYSSFTDPWMQSAVAGVASQNPAAFIKAALASENPDQYRSLVTVLTTQAAGKAQEDPEVAAALVMATAAAPAKADSLKVVVFDTLARSLRGNVEPKWTEPLRNAFQTALKANNPSVPAAALPLIARWDKQGSMANDVKALVGQLIGKLNDASQTDDQRAQIATSLLGVRQLNNEIVPAVTKIIGSSASPGLQTRVVESLGATADPAIGRAFAEALANVPTELRDTIFAQVIKRNDWSLALVDSLKEGKVTLATLGPMAVHRLRTHADSAVAKRANAVIDELRGPEVKEKNALIAKIEAELDKPANVQNGRQAFAANCAVCHRMNGEGKDLAPDLTGMGVHGAHELLVHILDPNRMVEDNYMTVSIETKDGETYDGMIGRENRSSVVLRNAVGDTEIKTSDIKSRRNTGRSLMPEGFEALGTETLRDMVSYMMAGDSKYRVIDLKSAFTADTRKGLFHSQEATGESLRFKKYGIIKAGEVPFEILNPARVTSGNNVVVLKGGSGFAKTLPQKVEMADVNVKANRLHFLGGVGGWAYPCCGENDRKDLPVAKVTVTYAGGGSEELILRNGVEFADYIDARYDVPGSKPVDDVVWNGQVRWFTKELKQGGTIQKIAIASFNNAVAPVFVGITAESGPAATKVADASSVSGVASDAPPVWKWQPGMIKAVTVGGGNSHDFGKWFDAADTKTLAEAKVSTTYTDKPDTIAGALKEIDLLYLSNNQPFKEAATRQAIFDFANAGKGLLLVHPALWYNWNNWPEYNRELVGGGARSHDKFGEFEVTITDSSHPITKGVPMTFKITDELYHFIPDEKGTSRRVLATGKSPVTGKTFPVVWITEHPKARIACITLGHDAKAHEHPAYKTLLQNAAKWAARK